MLFHILLPLKSLIFLWILKNCTRYLLHNNYFFCILISCIQFLLFRTFFVSSKIVSNFHFGIVKKCLIFTSCGLFFLHPQKLNLIFTSWGQFFLMGGIATFEHNWGGRNVNFHFLRMIFLMPPQKCTWLSPWGLFFKYPQKCHPIFSSLGWFF